MLINFSSIHHFAIGTTTKLRCFTCEDVPANYDTWLKYNTMNCNHFGSGVETCADGEVREL